MRVLKFIVSKQRIECDPECDFSDLASGTHGYLHATFRFSADCIGCKRVAIFSCRGKDYPIPLINGICEIPADALIGNTVGVRVIGQRGDTRITTNRVSFQQSSGRY